MRIVHEIDSDLNGRNGKNIVITLNDDGVRPDPEDEDDMQLCARLATKQSYVRIVGLTNPIRRGLSRPWSRLSRGTLRRLAFLSSCWAANSVPPWLAAAVRIKISTRAGSDDSPGR